MSDSILTWRNVDAVPLVHGRLPFALYVREQMLARRYAAVAVELPPSLGDAVLEAVRALPRVHAVLYREEPFVFREFDEEESYSSEAGEVETTIGLNRAWYVVLDPCDGMVEAMRIAERERTPLHFIDAEIEEFEARRTGLPDPHALLTLGLETFYRTLLPTVRMHPVTEQDRIREAHMAVQLRELAARCAKKQRGGEPGRVLFVTGMAHWERIRELLESGAGRLHSATGPPVDWVECVPVAEEALSQALGELPFVTWQYERYRAGFAFERHDPIQSIKELLVRAREHHERIDHGTLERASPAAMARVLDYLRRLTLSARRLSPDLYGLVVACKGVIGPRFALAALEVARSYPPNRKPGGSWNYSALEPPGPSSGTPNQERSKGAETGAAPAELPDSRSAEPTREPTPWSAADGVWPFEVADFETATPPQDELELSENHGMIHDQVAAMTPRAPGEERELRRVFLEERPPLPKRKEWRTAWNPQQQCSWPPEDLIIENLRAYVSNRALSLAGLDRVRSEEFLASLKDGIDLRETLRNFPAGKLYVREEPRVPGRVGAVVLIFEEDDAGTRFPWRTTWMAEHPEESTLAFYATNFAQDLIGPGIARAWYGGCMMLYPPIVIPEVWDDLRFERARRPSERLLLAALYYSHERFVSHVSERPPSREVRATAATLGKHIVHLPLSSFSSRLLERIRRVHVLNGKKVRSWAARFVR